MRPFSACVCALKALQNSMMLTPCWPSAGPTGRADEAGDAGRVLHDRPRLVCHVHVDEHVAGKNALLGLNLLPLFRLDHLLGRDDDATEPRRLVHRHDPVLEVGLHLVLVPGVGVDDVPAEHDYVKTFWTRCLNTMPDP